MTKLKLFVLIIRVLEDNVTKVENFGVKNYLSNPTERGPSRV